MRLPPISPDTMAPPLRAIHDRMAADVEQFFRGFVAQQSDGALIGPFPALLKFPKFGEPAWAYVRGLIEHSSLPERAHEVAILVVGAAFASRYELYAHEHVAAQAGLSPTKIAAIVAGQRPIDLDREEMVSYNVAHLLSRGGTLPDTTYQVAIDTFGEEATGELVYLVAGYAMLSILMNAFDAPAPAPGDQGA